MEVKLIEGVSRVVVEKKQRFIEDPAGKLQNRNVVH